MEKDHNHAHVIPTSINRAFIVGIILNSAFVIIEVIAGLWTHSLSLLTDAGHNLSDVASLVLALLATKLASKKANAQYTFGYKQSTVLAALINAGVLLFALGVITYEAIIRITQPHPIEGGLVAVVAGIGIIINSVTAFMFLKDKEKDLNIKGAYLHMAADALVSLGVVIAGIIIVYTHWFWLDAVVSLIIVVVIVFGTWDLLKESLRLTLNGVPRNIDMEKVKTYFMNLTEVKDVHDLHIWAISTTETALTVHLVIPGEIHEDHFYERIKNELHKDFDIDHSTIQIEKTVCNESCN